MKLIKQHLLPLATSIVLGSAITGASTMSFAENRNPNTPVSMISEWDKTFPQSNKVTHRKVSFQNLYGITLVADLYLPKDQSNTKHAAIAVSGPFGAVKEQSSGLYAQTLAEYGFVTLAFDPSYTGESGGYPRNMASPEINTEDFSAAVDYLGSLDNVNREKIGILGICGWGGFALNAAISETRIKAVATSTMYDMTRVTANGYNDVNDAEARYQMKKTINEARWQAAKNGYADLQPANNLRKEEFTAETPQFVKEYSDYYTTKRGFHPRAVNSNPDGSWATTSSLSLMNMPILQYASENRTPALLIHGENAHSRYFSEDAYKALGNKDKELYILPNATHVDLYDNQAGKIPFEKLNTFFKAHLK